MVSQMNERERQLSVVETPLFLVGKGRVKIADVLRTERRPTERKMLCEADNALRDAQRLIAELTGYPYGRKGN